LKRVVAVEKAAAAQFELVEVAVVARAVLLANELDDRTSSRKRMLSRSSCTS